MLTSTQQRKVRHLVAVLAQVFRVDAPPVVFDIVAPSSTATAAYMDDGRLTVFRWTSTWTTDVAHEFAHHLQAQFGTLQPLGRRKFSSAERLAGKAAFDRELGAAGSLYDESDRESEEFAFTFELAWARLAWEALNR